MNLRDTPIYAKHFAADAEPEEHARISIQYAIDELQELRETLAQGDMRYPVNAVDRKILKLRASL